MVEPAAVIFDLDDTLYPERRFALSGYAAVARRLAEETGRPAGVLYRAMVGEYRADRRATLLQHLVSRFELDPLMVEQAITIIRTHPPRLRLPHASRDALLALRSEGYRLGILSNGLPDTQRGKVAALALTGLMDVVVYAQDHAPFGKPAAACFTAVLEALAVAPSRAVFVGDHPEKDIAGARAAGLSTIWMAGGAWKTRPDADAIATSVREVPALVRRLLEPRHAAHS